MGDFFAELKRRNIYRVGAAYAVVTWILLQLAANVAPILDLPPWVARTILLLLVLGFPIALIFAWVQQLAPERGTTPRTANGRLDWFLATALLVVIAMEAYQQIAPSQVAQDQPRVAAVPSARASLSNVISIAVLPFANLSSDKEQEFFSDGMTEEITSALAKVPNLRVVGRTSAFQFKGENKDLIAIGQALHATHLIEGSVRKDRNEVRITAQLIRADDGTHLWAESYNRELKGVFALQEEIATAIAVALQAPLGLKQGETLVQSRTGDEGAYEDYLRARAMLRGRGGRSTRALAQIGAAENLLESVLARDPNFAPAWALLGLANAFTITSGQEYMNGSSVDEARRLVNAQFPRAEAAAQRAIQLDPNRAEGYVTLARLQVARGKLVLAEDLYSKALALDPSNPDVLALYANMLAEVARLREAAEMKQRLGTLDSLDRRDDINTARILWLNGQNDPAIALLKGQAPEVEEGPIILAEIYASMGRYGEAADALMGLGSGFYPPAMVEAAIRLLRAAPAASQTLPRLGFLGFVYLHVGAPDRVLGLYERNVEIGYAAAIDIALLWHPSYAPVRKTARFKKLMRDGGLVEYWRARGWPDLCRPVGSDDFVCD